MIGPRASAAVRSCIASAASVRRMSKAVVFSDPRLVFDPSEREQAARARKPGEPRCCVQLTLSDAAAAQLAEPQYHPADTSEPGNSWVVGEQVRVGGLFEMVDDMRAHNLVAMWCIFTEGGVRV